MRLTLHAIAGGFEADEYSLICGLTGSDASGREHGLVFQRVTEGQDPVDDWGVYLEFDDQVNGEYNRIAACRLSRSGLAVDLSGPLGALDGVTGFDVELAFDDVTYRQIATGLSRIFRGVAGLVLVDDQQGRS